MSRPNVHYLEDFNRFFERTAGPLLHVAGLPERSWLTYAGRSPERPPTFVVGPPRSGTTLVYLHLINAFEFAYVSNLTKFLHWIPLTSSRLSRAVGDDSETYENSYGHVPGLDAPSDAWNLLESLYDDDRLTPTARTYLRHLVGALERLDEAPFLLKNNRLVRRLESMLRTFPDALVVGVLRDPFDAALSLAEARERHGVADRLAWICPPRERPSWNTCSNRRQALYNIVSLSRELLERLGRAPESSRVRLVRYREFCSRPGALTDWLENQYELRGWNCERRDVELPTQFESNRRDHSALSESTRREVRDELGLDSLRELPTSRI